jgi:hypothetical protein
LGADATDTEIDGSVAARGQGWLTPMVIRRTLKGMLRRRAYVVDLFRGMAEAARFGCCEIICDSIGSTAWLGR